LGCQILVRGDEDAAPVKAALLCVGVFAAVLATPAGAAAADFTITPSSVTPGGGVITVKTGTELTFEAQPPELADSWDLNGDGIGGDYTGGVATWSYPTPGPITITLYAPDGPVAKTIQIVGPAADFHVSPAVPIAGQPVSFAYSQRQDVRSIEWDLNGDHSFPDESGPFATRTFPTPGTYAVSLRVANLDDPPATSTSTQLITVVPPKVTPNVVPPAPRLMSPFPVVRITGKVNKRGARIRRLTVRAPKGATIGVRCRGRTCPFRRTNRTVAPTGSAQSPSKTVRVKRLEGKLLRGGALIKVLVSRAGEIGKYTRFKIRRGKSPLRNDLCLLPGSTVPRECPTS
jgi:PKD repeat protein